MDERVRAFLAAQVSDDELATLLAEARAAALDEVRERLRQTMVEELLGRLAAEPSSPMPAAGAVPEAAPPPPPARAVEGVVEPLGAPAPPDDLAAELTALRAQLTVNQAWLTGDLGGAPEPAPAPPQHDPTPPPPRPASLLWAYAVRRADRERLGVDINILPELIPGVADGAPLGAVACGDLEALVSAVPSAEFAEEAFEERLQDPAWLERVALGHQEALAALLAQGTLVPLRFATMFTGAERVAAMVAERADELRAALDYLEGRGEWGVKLLVDEAALAERIADASPAVRELRDAIAAKPAGAAYMLQKRLERLAADEARRISDACADAALAALAAASVAAARSALRELPGAVMLLNGAYLVADSGQAAFASALDALRAEYAPLGFRLELTGPWPPYTFAAPPDAASSQ